jgi:hypothetical protein
VVSNFGNKPATAASPCALNPINCLIHDDLTSTAETNSTPQETGMVFQTYHSRAIPLVSTRCRRNKGPNEARCFILYEGHHPCCTTRCKYMPKNE